MTEVLFSDQHEYIKTEGDIGIIGISEYAQNALGDVVYVELPAVGDTVDQGDQIGVIESVKSASEMYSPVSGEIIEVNEELTNNPALINNDPMEEGWIVKIKLSDTSELDGLKDENAYAEYTEGL